MTKPIYAVGDIHGQHTELVRVLSLIETDGGPDAEIVFIGDYTDRGPASSAVLDTLIAGVAAGKPWHCLKGNHDRMFSWFMRDYPQHDAYLPIHLLPQSSIHSAISASKPWPSERATATCWSKRGRGCAKLGRRCNMLTSSTLPLRGASGWRPPGWRPQPPSKPHGIIRPWRACGALAARGARDPRGCQPRRADGPQ